MRSVDEARKPHARRRLQGAWRDRVHGLDAADDIGNEGRDLSGGWGSGAVGLAAARNALGLKTSIIGVVSASASTYALSFAAGRVVEQKSATRIADGIAISRAHEVSLDILRREIERVVQVTDDEIEEAMRAIFTDTHNVAEGAGAAAVAALLKDRGPWSGKRVGVGLSGGNVDREVFARVMANELRSEAKAANLLASERHG